MEEEKDTKNTARTAMETDRDKLEAPIILPLPYEVPSYFSAEPHSNLEEVRAGNDNEHSSPSLFSSHPGTQKITEDQITTLLDRI